MDYCLNLIRLFTILLNFAFEREKTKRKTIINTIEYYKQMNQQAKIKSKQKKNMMDNDIFMEESCHAFLFFFILFSAMRP